MREKGEGKERQTRGKSTCSGMVVYIADKGDYRTEGGGGDLSKGWGI